MSQQIDQIFIDMFEADMHHAFQREGAKLTGMCRHGGTGEGKSVFFPKMLKGKARGKARHGDVDVADRGENRVQCNITDDYFRDMVDDLDELKTNVAARMEYARDHAWILGRKTDDKIIQAINASTNETTDVGVITLPKVNETFTYLGDQAVPVDGQRYAAVSPKGWTDLMAIPQFSNADYVAEGEMPYKGSAGTAKRWFSFYWFTQEGTDTDDGALPKTGNTRSSLVWHRRAVGFHMQKEPSTETDRNVPAVAWDIVSHCASGAIIIDELGTYKIRHDETATPS